MMPRKKISYNTPTRRSKRNKIVKKVFDPSDNFKPRRKMMKFSTVLMKKKKSKKQKILKKSKLGEKKEITVIKSENDSAIESLDSSNENMSASNIPSGSPVQLTRLTLPENICFKCFEVIGQTDFVHCPICFTKVHMECLITYEPTWKLKLDLCLWLCEQCRKIHCCICLEGESESDIKFRCITCNVGLDSACYDTCEIKPLESVKKPDIFICIPCLDLATVIPGEENEESVKIENESVKSHSPNTDDGTSLLSEDGDGQKEDNEGLTSTDSDISFSSFTDSEKDEHAIPDVTQWTKYQVYEYFADRLPEPVLTKIKTHEIDGRALLLLQRTDITYKMGLKLGHALKFYKQVRIIQTQSTYHKTYWE